MSNTLCALLIPLSLPVFIQCSLLYAVAPVAAVGDPFATGGFIRHRQHACIISYIHLIVIFQLDLWLTLFQQNNRKKYIKLFIRAKHTQTNTHINLAIYFCCCCLWCCMLLLAEAVDCVRACSVVRISTMPLPSVRFFLFASASFFLRSFSLGFLLCSWIMKRKRFNKNATTQTDSRHAPLTHRIIQQQ